MVTGEIQVAPGNRQQLDAWDGEEGAFWANNADAFEKAIAGFDPALFEAAAIGVTDRVLDVGCGTGSTAREAARRATQGVVVGVDLSSAMLAEARIRAAGEGLTNLSFRQADVQVHPFDAGEFDVAIGRTSAMFFADRIAALANIRRGVRQGGRIALLVWQPPTRNEWFLELTGAMAAGRDLPAPPPDMPHPFSLADPVAARESLGAAGWVDVTVEGLDGQMALGPDADSAFDFVLGLLGWMLDDLDDDGRRRARNNLRRTIDAHARPSGVAFAASVWLVTGRT